LQLLHPKIPKNAKKTECLTVFFALSGFGYVKAFRKMLVKSTSGDNGKLTPEEKFSSKVIDGTFNDFSVMILIEIH
jgi:hypothetical protein